MNYNVGDFILTYKSDKPAIIISKNEKTPSFLISISEYGGDYMWIFLNEIIKKPDLDSAEKLSCIAGFGEWFYDQHKLLYQELIIENITK